MKKFITKKQEREVTTEDLNSDVKIILELVTDMAPKVSKTAEDVEIMKEDIAMLKTGHKIMAQDIKVMQADLKEVKTDPKQKADQKDLVALDHRVTHLEAKVA